MNTERVHAQRNNTDPVLGTSAEGALFTAVQNADGSLTITPASNTDASLGARIYYTAAYYDAADRSIATVNAGTNPVGTSGAATPWARPATAPTSVSDANFPGDIITLTNYNAAGWLFETTDGNGNVAANFYDSMGRLTETIASYGTSSTDLNQTTLYTFDGLGDQTSMTAEDPSTGNQLTDYVYGVSTATGSEITSNDLLYQTVYPAAGQTTIVTDGYNAVGQVIFTADRNGNVHSYTYDNFGRQISDAVTTLGAGVDGSVLRIDTAYNNQGLAYLLTSYADTAGTQIVNQVENVYNGLGQLTQQYQAVTGAVDMSATPSVQYTYSDPSTGSVLTSMVYPNGRTINYNYGDTGGVLMNNNNAMLDQAVGRLDGIIDAGTGTVLEQYSYLGLSTIVARNHPQSGINLTLVGGSGSIGSGGDQYVGLDGFGRVVDQKWINTTATTITDEFTYSYDQNNNVTAKNNLLNTAYSEAYTYDQLNRLTAVTRGGAAYQSWGLDAQGNWSSFTSNGSTQTRTANDQNQITSISGTSATPTYDADGNMTQDRNGDTLVYDAWNRLVEVKNSAGQVIAQYTYNAQGYAVTATYPQGTSQLPAGTTNYLYYTSSWQLIEVRTGGTATGNVTEQMVWSASYVNAAVLQDSYYNGVLQANQRLYFQQDADWNTTSVVGYDSTTGTWNVVQRYVYSPYGTVTILNADWSAPLVGTNPTVNNLYQGMALDPVTGLYYERARWYSPSLGTWISQDPLQYINGANTYQFVMGSPTGAMDPSGLATVVGFDPYAKWGPSPYVEPQPGFAPPTPPPGFDPWGPTGTPVPWTAPLAPAEGGGLFLSLLDSMPWLAALAPLFDTPPAGGAGDMIPVWNRAQSGSKTGPQDQSGVPGGARGGQCSNTPAGTGGAGNKPPGGKAVAAPGGNEPNKGNLRKIGSNSRANQIAQDLGYENAEKLKGENGFNPPSQFDMYRDNNGDVYVMGKGGIGQPQYIGTLPK